jgi:N6-adenosine-specific RNA methylase IME4
MTKSKVIPFPNKKYNIIYADPAWKFRDRCVAGSRGSEFKYPCMTLDEICSLPVKDIADENCYLFLWLPNSMTREGMKVMESWGFTWKLPVFNWVKRGKSGKLFWGMGSYSRGGFELCWLGIKGRLKRQSASVHSVIESPKREHSRKPDEARDRITQLYGDIPKIELFAREKFDGWDNWGLAVTKSGEYNNK